MGLNIKEIKEKYENVKCIECGEIHNWDEYDCEVYNDDFLCAKCFQEKYGYCNICGELNKYSDMNENIECKECANV